MNDCAIGYNADDDVSVGKFFSLYTLVCMIILVSCVKLKVTTLHTFHISHFTLVC